MLYMDILYAECRNAFTFQVMVEVQVLWWFTFVYRQQTMTHPLVLLAKDATDTTLPKLVVLIVMNLTTLDLLELAGFYLPVILGVLFFISFYSTAHDVSTLMLSLGIALNNLLNTALREFLNLSRPEPFLEAGQPCRETQTMFFFITFYAVYAHFWSEGRGWSGPFTLVVTLTWSIAVYIANEYYTTSQVLGGAFVGAAFGLSFANYVRLSIVPHAHVYTFNWNNRVDNWWWTFGFLHIAHSYHYHPGTHCTDKYCKGSYTYTIIPIVPHTGNVDFGASLLLHTLFKIVLYVLIHFNT